MISVTEALLGRRSTRAFLDRPVAMEVVRDIIETARRTPSGGNLQPWKLAAMTGEDLKQLKASVRESFARNPKGEGSEYPIYPNPLKETYDERRRKCGEDMYAAIGIGRENKQGRLQQFVRNYDFFGAPVGMILAMDRTMGSAQWTDAGIFLQSVLLLAQERGLATCPQAAWAVVHKTVRAHLAWPDELAIICGISLGYADPAHPINAAVMDRAPFDDVAQLRGFTAASAQALSSLAGQPA